MLGAVGVGRGDGVCGGVDTGVGVGGMTAAGSFLWFFWTCMFRWVFLEIYAPSSVLGSF